VIEVSESACLITAGWDDVPHLDADTKKTLLERTPPYLRDARSKGTPSLGAGAIYPIPESEITVPIMPIPPHWRRAYAMDVGWNCTATLWGAIDPETTVMYVNSEYKQGQQLPTVHSAAIRARGDWIPGVIDPAARGRSQKDGEQLLADYQSQLKNLTISLNAVEPGLYLVWELFATGRLKVMANCLNFFNEYRLYRRDEKGHIVKKNDHLMDCLRYLCLSGRDVAKVKPFDLGAGLGSGLSSANPMGY
jgi:hypothetical protein